MSPTDEIVPLRRHWKSGILQLGLFGGLLLLLPACSDGNFTVLGYSTRPNYPSGIHTIRVPIFQNNTAYRDLEFELTKSVVNTIELMTPYKVVGLGEDADTELVGTIANFHKTILNRNQLNEVREAEMLLAVTLVWRDLRTGEILTRPPVKRGFQPPPSPEAPPAAVPVVIQANASFIPELGESITTARKRAIDRLAVQIVSEMEVPW
jgi:hypothetical protein